MVLKPSHWMLTSLALAACATNLFAQTAQERPLAEDRLRWLEAVQHDQICTGHYCFSQKYQRLQVKPGNLDEIQVEVSDGVLHFRVEDTELLITDATASGESSSLRLRLVDHSGKTTGKGAYLDTFASAAEFSQYDGAGADWLHDELRVVDELLLRSAGVFDHRGLMLELCGNPILIEYTTRECVQHEYGDESIRCLVSSNHYVKFWLTRLHVGDLSFTLNGEDRPWFDNPLFAKSTWYHPGFGAEFFYHRLDRFTDWALNPYGDMRGKEGTTDKLWHQHKIHAPDINTIAFRNKNVQLKYDNRVNTADAFPGIVILSRSKSKLLNVLRISIRDGVPMLDLHSMLEGHSMETVLRPIRLTDLPNGLFEASGYESHLAIQRATPQAIDLMFDQTHYLLQYDPQHRLTSLALTGDIVVNGKEEITQLLFLPQADGSSLLNDVRRLPRWPTVP